LKIEENEHRFYNNNKYNKLENINDAIKHKHNKDNINKNNDQITYKIYDNNEENILKNINHHEYLLKKESGDDNNLQNLTNTGIEPIISINIIITEENKLENTEELEQNSDVSIDFIYLDYEINNENDNIKEEQEEGYRIIDFIHDILPLYQIKEIVKNRNAHHPKENDNIFYYLHNNISVNMGKNKNHHYMFLVLENK